MATSKENQQRLWREHYARNRQQYIDRAAARRQRAKQEVREYKESHGCMDCKVKYPYFVLDFDHRDPSLKSGHINSILSRMGTKALWDEIAKCDVVCANCHRIRTHSGIG